MAFEQSFPSKSISRFSLQNISLTIFIIVGLFAALNHSLWRDEMQGWLVAWRSDSWYSLWKNNAPSGHPILWSALIYMVKGVTNSPLSMQLLHWVLGSLAMLCFWRWNPLPGWQKALFTFGYYPFWEYYFVCRHYVLAELFTFLFCSCYPLRRRTYIPSALIIGLLANTHAFAWSIAFAAFSILLFEWLFSSKQRSSYLKNKFWTQDLFLSCIILVTLTAFGAFSLLQVRDVVGDLPSHLDLRHLLRVIGRVFGGYVLIIPNSQRYLDLYLCSLITIALVASTLSFLRISRLSLLFFISGSGFLFAFNYFLYLGVGSRHYGYYFLILIASVWIALHPDEPRKVHKPSSIFLLTNQLSDIFPYLLTFCLSIHFAAGVHRAAYDFYTPYSAGKATSEYIKEMGWVDEPKFGTRDVEVTTISGYLDRDIYYPELKEIGSYSQWNRRVSLDRNDTLFYIKSYFEDFPRTDRLLLILSKGSAFPEMLPGDERVHGDLRIKADQRFERSWTKPERFYLYWAERIYPSKVDSESVPLQNKE